MQKGVLCDHRKPGDLSVLPLLTMPEVHRKRFCLQHHRISGQFRVVEWAGEHRTIRACRGQALCDILLQELWLIPSMADAKWEGRGGSGGHARCRPSNQALPEHLLCFPRRLVYAAGLAARARRAAWEIRVAGTDRPCLCTRLRWARDIRSDGQLPRYLGAFIASQGTACRAGFASSGADARPRVVSGDLFGARLRGFSNWDPVPDSDPCRGPDAVVDPAHANRAVGVVRVDRAYLLCSAGAVGRRRERSSGPVSAGASLQPVVVAVCRRYPGPGLPRQGSPPGQLE